MPVTDQEERLVGILTMDDVLDIVDEEDAEDLARGSGTEPLDRSYLSSTIIRLVKSRIVWLLVLAVSAILTVQVLEVYEDRLDQVVVLALFIPLLTGTGGNTGNQAATTVTRALAVGEVRVRDLGRVIWRELRVGAVLGSVLGTLGFVVAGLVYGWAIGLVIGLTLLSVCIMAATVGGLMPIIAKKVATRGVLQRSSPRSDAAASSSTSRSPRQCRSSWIGVEPLSPTKPPTVRRNVRRRRRGRHGCLPRRRVRAP